MLLIACGDDATSDAGADTGTDTTIDAPTVDAPTVDAPTVDAPGVDAPGVDAPGVDAPGVDAPAIDAAVDAPVGTRGAIRFFENETREHDYGIETVLPDGFGDGEFTFELWMRLDDSFPVGPATGGESQLREWCNVDNEPYSSGSWWYKGNFLLDGHNNNSFDLGTFSLQFYGGGRLRWLFGDGGSVAGHWSVGAYPATTTASLLDDTWHAVAVVRRFSGASNATLELWIDGTRIATETSDVRTDMRMWWNDWSAFPGDQPGWFWGAEKQAAVLTIDQYEDYKGDIAELRYWSVARSESDLGTPTAVTGSESGLVGWYPFDEGSGTQACDALDRTRCMTFMRTGPELWTTGPVL